uniref:Uncharacterized protein n=1 Tax=Solanum lycopersicum TaxID=4081 RepID=A0A3Q7EAW5_SOLLC
MAISGGHLFHPHHLSTFFFSFLPFQMYPLPHACRSFIPSKNGHGPSKNDNIRRLLLYVSSITFLSDQKRSLHCLGLVHRLQISRNFRSRKLLFAVQREYKISNIISSLMFHVQSEGWSFYIGTRFGLKY